VLNRSTYFVREHIGFLKLSDTYDILDPETNEQIGIAKERPSWWVYIARLWLESHHLPTKVDVYEGLSFDDPTKLLFSIERGFTFLRSQVNVRSSSGALLGWFKSKLLTLGGAFSVFDASGNQIATLQGDWVGWNFRFIDNSKNEIGVVTKHWAGLGQEFFTTADKYVISLNRVEAPGIAVLMLAAGLAVDIVYKEDR
jgi:uncharacterized protein YxjI